MDRDISISCDEMANSTEDHLKDPDPFILTEGHLAILFRLIAGLPRHDAAEPQSVSSYLDSGLINPLVLFIDKELSRHNRKCQHLPAKLRLVADWRSHDRKRPSICEAMLEEPPHTWIQEIYQNWLKEHRETEHICTSGELFEESTLQSHLRGEDSKMAAQRIASTVWALRLARDERWQQILEGLAVIFRGDAIRPENSQSGRSNERSAVKRGKERENEVRAEIRLLTRARNDAQRKVKSLSEQLTHSKSEAKRARQDLATARKEAQKVESEMSKLSNQMKRLDDELIQLRRRIADQSRQLENAEKRHIRITSEYENECESHVETKEQVKVLEESLQSTRTELDQLPKGLNAAWVAMETELDEVKLRRDTSQGNTRSELGRKYNTLKNIADEFISIYPKYAPSAYQPQITSKKAEVSFESLGGGTEIGASCYLLRVGSSEVLIDAGIRMNRRVDEIGPDLSRWDNQAPTFHAVIVTHAHNDHSGWLPAMVARWMFLDIFCTPETKELLEVMLQDSFKNIQRELAKCNVLSRFTGKTVPDLPYTEEDIETVLRNIRTLNFGETHSFGPDLQFKFLPAGHILGAASVLFEGSGRRVLLSGDYSTFDQRTVNGCNWSEARAGGIDLLVSESTYGHCRGSSRAEAESELIKEIEVITSEGGTVLIPCFALGRAQEVITIIDRAFRSGDLKSLRVWVDGMIDRINPIYRRFGSFSVGDEFVEVRPGGYTIQDVLDWSQRNPSIIVTTSGMMNGGPVTEYAKWVLPDAHNRVLLCGYQDEGSKGKSLLRAFESDASRRKLRLDDDEGGVIEVDVKAGTRKVDLSAHSDVEQMAQAIVDVNPANVVLVHGEPNERINLALALRRRGLRVAEAPSILIPEE